VSRRFGPIGTPRRRRRVVNGFERLTIAGACVIDDLLVTFLRVSFVNTSTRRDRRT